MNIIEKFIKVLERYMDNLSIKKKFIQLYIFCVLLPLIITDSVVLYIEDSMESQRQYHEMANVANAVSYNISALVENAGEIAKSMYTDRRMNTFLEKQYESTSDYYAEYQNFFQDSTLENVLGMNQIVFTLYTDNPTVVKGGKIDNMSNLKETAAYEAWKERGENEGLFFVYERKRYANSYHRKIILLQNLDFFSKNKEKMLQIEFDYNSMMRMLRRMKFDNEVLICQGDAIVLSNGPFSGVGKKFDTISVQQKMGYKQTITLHGAKLDIYVLKADNRVRSKIVRFLPILGFLVIINVVLPMGFVLLLNHSFTKRIRGLSKVFQSVNGEHLVQMAHEDGRDEIGSMIRNYNRMVKRTNELIQTVYKNKIKEQEILVGRKNAELLALQSQINPHFLYNTLNSIKWMADMQGSKRMVTALDSLIKLMQFSSKNSREVIRIQDEIDLIRDYINLINLKYFDRIFVDVHVEPGLENCETLKFLLQPIVENSIYHGFSSMVRQCTVQINITRKEDRILYEVIDNGKGMSKEKIRQALEEDHPLNSHSFNKIGLYNVNKRIQYIFGEEYGIQIDSEPGKYTRVIVEIPARIYKEEMANA